MWYPWNFTNYDDITETKVSDLRAKCPRSLTHENWIGRQSRNVGFETPYAAWQHRRRKNYFEPRRKPKITQTGFGQVEESKCAFEMPNAEQVRNVKKNNGNFVQTALPCGITNDIFHEANYVRRVERFHTLLLVQFNTDFRSSFVILYKKAGNLLGLPAGFVSLSVFLLWFYLYLTFRCLCFADERISFSTRTATREQIQITLVIKLRVWDRRFVYSFQFPFRSDLTLLSNSCFTHAQDFGISFSSMRRTYHSLRMYRNLEYEIRLYIF